MIYAIHRHPRARALTIGAALALTGCTTDLDDATPQPAETSLRFDVGTDSAAVDGGSREPQSGWLAELVEGSPIVGVFANGPGCPAGSGSAHLSPDGKTLSIDFSSYYVALQQTGRVATKDCQLVIKVEATEAISYAVTEIVMRGYAYLEPGVKARTQLNHYSAGIARPPSELPRTDLVGPFDGHFNVGETLGADELLWAHCGHKAHLNVTTRTSLQREQDEKKGRLSFATSEGNPEPKLRLKLDFRKCSIPQPTGQVQDAVPR